MIKNLKIGGLLLALAFLVSCAQTGEIGGRATNGSNASNPAAKSGGGGVNVPGNMKNAYRDGELTKEGAAIVTLPNDADVLYRKDAQKLSMDELGKKLEEYSSAPAGNGANQPKTVYLVADAGNEYASVIKILELARRKRIEAARLVVSRNERGEPADVFEVRLSKEPDHDETKRPNPNTLVATLLKDGKYRLNFEERPLNELKVMLRNVFEDRDLRGVFREGTNEIEQTVRIKAPLSAKYEEVVKLIDAVREAGANPIVIEIDDLEK